MNSALSNLAISLPMARLFSSPKRHRGCFTGLNFGSMFMLCSASSLGTPFMLAGCQAKMSLFSWRNSTSAFLFGIQVRPNGDGLGGIAYHKFHRLGLDGGLERKSGVGDLLLRRGHL